MFLSGSTGLFNRHFSCAALLGRALLFILAVTSAANAQQPSQPTKLDILLAFFYKDPQPERLVGIFASLQSQSSQWGAYPPVAGLFAGLFKLHPDWIERLTPGSPDPKAASTLVAALRLSGQSAKADLLRAKFANGGLDQRLEAEFARLPSRIEDLQISTAATVVTYGRLSTFSQMPPTIPNLSPSMSPRLPSAWAAVRRTC